MRTTTQLMIVSTWPVFALAQAPTGLRASLDLDAGTLVIEGHGLSGANVRLSSGDRVLEDVCGDDDARCELPTPRDLPAVPEQQQVVVTTASGTSTVRPRIAIERPLDAELVVDLSGGVARVPLHHPEAIAMAGCAPLRCTIESGVLVVGSELVAPEDRATIYLELRPRVLTRDGQSSIRSAARIVHCLFDLVSGPPFRELATQRVVLATTAECAAGATRILWRDRALQIDASAVSQGRTFLVARIDRIDEDDVLLELERAGAMVGAARSPTREAPRAAATLSLPEVGTIDFVPTNREARVVANASATDVDLVARSVEGAYRVRVDETGAWIRGDSLARGSFALRFEVRSRRPELGWMTQALAVVDEPIARLLRPANLPIDLAALTTGDAPAIELLCGDGTGHPRALRPGVTSSVPFRSRDTCHLVVHRDRLRAEDGTQTLKLRTEVNPLQGEHRVEERQFTATAGSGEIAVHIGGARAEFDRAVLELAIEDRPDHYVAMSGVSSVAWTVIFGTSSLRLYATAAIPSGLFRIGEDQATGLLPLNAGVLVRLAFLSREGSEFPLGFEAGLMWLGIGTSSSTSMTNDRFGTVAMVAGLGLAVPLANAASETQTAVNLHAWFEWDVSRTVQSAPGAPVAFVFGPSFSLGDVGINL